MAYTVYTLAEGEMGCFDGQGNRSLPAVRVEQYRQRLRELERKHDWKTSGEGAKFMGKQNPYANASWYQGKVADLCALGDEVLYAANFHESGGIYRKDPKAPEEEESIVYVSQALRTQRLHTRNGRIAASILFANGECHIALLSTEQSGMQMVTDGDTEDTSPFLTQDADSIYYASRGFARDENGVVLARGPSAILRLSLRTQELEEVCEDSAFDYLCPKVAENGTLYCIRRPYQEQPRDKGPSLKDALLLPARMVLGLGRFLRLMASAFGGAPPSAKESDRSDVKARNMSQQEMTLNGTRVQIDKARREAEQRGEKHPGIAPGDWELVRRQDDGSFEVLRKGVVDFDLVPDGGIVVTNGRFVLELKDGNEKVLCRDKTVTRVVVSQSHEITSR